MKYFSRTCDGGKQQACMEMGYFYIAGVHVERNVERGLQLLEQSCEAGEPLGCLGLAEVVDKGEVVPADKARAMIAYDKSCTLGEVRGCLRASTIAAERGETESQARLIGAACKLGDAPSCAGASK